jgi:hypothetical protein
VKSFVLAAVGASLVAVEAGLVGSAAKLTAVGARLVAFEAKANNMMKANQQREVKCFMGQQ